MQGENNERNLTTKEIRALPQILRLVGYISRTAKLSEIGAKLRAVKEDEEWTSEEEKEWEDACDELDPWYMSLSDDERKLVRPIDIFMSELCIGKIPENIK